MHRSYRRVEASKKCPRASTSSRGAVRIGKPLTYPVVSRRRSGLAPEGNKLSKKNLSLHVLLAFEAKQDRVDYEPRSQLLFIARDCGL